MEKEDHDIVYVLSHGSLYKNKTNNDIIDGVYRTQAMAEKAVEDVKDKIHPSLDWDCFHNCITPAVAMWCGKFALVSNNPVSFIQITKHNVNP